MKKIFLLMMMLCIPVFSSMAGSDSGNYIFSLGHKGVQGKDQILFNSFATEDIGKGQKASINWSLNKLDKSYSVLINGNNISSNQTGDYEFYPAESTLVVISLFDNTKNKIVEEHKHQINVYGIPKITSLTTGSQIVKSGANVVLNWTGENLGKVTFTPSAVAVNANNAIVKPTVATTYLMTATNPIGLFDTKEITLTTSDYIPTITSFTMDKSEVYRTNSVNLTWTSTDSESVDLFVDGELSKAGLAANGTYEYVASSTGVKSMQLRAKDKYFGLYGLVVEKVLTVKESDSWDFLPRLINTTSIKAGQSLNFEWAAGSSAKSITVSYKTDNVSEWTVLPITNLAGSYSLPINDIAANSAEIKFELIKSNGAQVNASVTGSLIKSTISGSRVYNGGTVTLNVSQGIEYRAYIYINNVQYKGVLNGNYVIPLGTTAGEYTIDLRTKEDASSVVNSYKVVMLPVWMRKPDLSRSVVFAGDDVVLSWSIQSPFKSATIKRVSNLGQSTIESQPVSGTYSDKLLTGETSVVYTVTVSTAEGETLSESASLFLAASDIAISEASFAQAIPLTFLNSTPSKNLYIDGVFAKLLSGTTYSITGLSVGKHFIEVKSSYGTFPDSNRVWSKEISVLPSTTIEIQSDFLSVEVGKSFNWSWYVPDAYDTVEVLETKAGVQTKVSANREGTLLSTMMSTAGSTLTVKASSNGGAVTTKTLVVDAFAITGLNDEYNFSESPIVKVTGSASIYINGVYYSAISNGSQTSFTIPSAKLTPGVNEISFINASTRTGQKMDVLLKTTKLSDVIFTTDHEIAYSGSETGVTWSVPSEYIDIKVTKTSGSITENISIAASGYHSAVMPKNNITYSISATTKQGKVYSASVIIYFYTVTLSSEIDNTENAKLTILAGTFEYFDIYLNGSSSKIARYETNTSNNGKETAYGATAFLTGKNQVVIKPDSTKGMNYTAALTRLSASNNPQKLDYTYAITGMKNYYEWDITTEYSVVQVKHNGVIVSNQNSGRYEFTQSTSTDGFSIYTETPSGYSVTRTLISYPVTASLPKEIVDYTSPTIVFYSPYLTGTYYDIYVNNAAYTAYDMRYNTGISISNNRFISGDNEVKAVARNATVMPWATTIKKLESVTASANYDVALVGTEIVYNWNIPDEYPTFKIESKVKNITTVVDGSRTGSFSHLKSDGYTDTLTITATNANGVTYVKTVNVQYLKVVPRANRVTASELYYLDVTGTFSGAKVYINGVYARTITAPGSISFSHSSFLTDRVNTISYVPSGLAGDETRVAGWSGEVVAFKEPVFTSDYDYIAPTDTNTYRWSVDDSLYETVTVTHSKSTGVVVLSTSKEGAADAVKVMSDSVILRAVTYTGEVYTKTLSIRDFDVYRANPIVYQGITAVYYYKGVTSSIYSTVDTYVNGVKYGSIGSYNSYSNASIANSAFVDGNNEVKLVYTGSYYSKAKPFYFNVEKKPEMTLSSDLEHLLVGDDVQVSWTIPSVYSNPKVMINSVVVSSDQNGTYTYTVPSSAYIYLNITAKTAEGSTATFSKTIVGYNVEMRPYSGVGDSVNSVEVSESQGPKMIYVSPQGTSASIYVNGVLKATQASSATAFTFNASYLSLGDNKVEVFTNNSLENGLPSSKHLYFTGNVTMIKRATITTPVPVVIVGNNVKYTWDVPSEYDSAVVTATINGVSTVISTEKSGEYEHTRLSNTYDTVKVDSKKGVVEYTVSTSTNAATFSTDSDIYSPTQSPVLNYSLYSYAKDIDFDIYVNGVLKTTVESTTYTKVCGYSCSWQYISTGLTKYTMSSSWFNAGENDIEVKFRYYSQAVQTWKKTITVAKAPELTVDNNLMHIGDVATFAWNADPIYKNVKITLTQNSVAKIISTDKNEGSHSYIKETGSDSIKIEATGDNGLTYTKSVPVYYMSLLVPALVAKGQSVSLTYVSQYPSVDIYVNGTKRTSLSSSTTVTLSDSFFAVGDNTIEVIQTGTYAATARKWTGKVIVAAAPDFSVSYNMAHIGEVISINWDAPSIYTTVKVSLIKPTGTTVISSSGNTGTSSYIKETGNDSIKIEASNSSGASYTATIPVQYMSVLFPATIAKNTNAAYTFKSGDGKGAVYLNGILIQNISVTADSTYNGSISASKLNVGNNTIEVIPTGTYSTTAKKWVGNIIVTE